MEAKELRIGDYLEWEDESHGVVKVVGVYEHRDYENEVWVDYFEHGYVYSARFDEFKPIPLSEEWLLKFGFKQWGDKYTFGLKGINIHHRQRGFVLRKSVPVIQYVHQLQNLYRCLCGKELEILH